MCVFFFNDTATTEIYTLSLHDALPIYIGMHSENLMNFKNQVAKEKVLDKIVVKSNNNVHVIPLNEVTYIESEDDYVMVHSAKGKYLQHQTMN